LAGITGEQIAEGLNRWEEKWPPSLFEFRDACTGTITDEFGIGYVPEIYRVKTICPNRRLSSDARDKHRKEIIAKCVDELREVLKGKKP
jgi:hypothetical protein